METYAVIKRNMETANKVESILGLPNHDWSEIHVEFGTDEVAVARVTLLLTGEQLQLLAAIAYQRNALYDPT